MKEIQPSVNDARLQAILDESRTRAKQVSDSNKFCEAEWQKLGELSDALFLFSCWREVLERDLKRRPSQDECCERFGLLVSGLKTVVRQHGYEDFYQMIADSNAPNAEHHNACDILHQLLTSPNEESRTIINQLYGQDIPVCRYVFATLVPMLYGRWLTDYANIRRLPEIATLDHLGFVGDLRPEGFSLLIRTRPDFADFCEQLRYFRPPIEVNPNGIQGFIDVLRADENGPAQNLLSLPLDELAELIASRNKRDQERAAILDEPQSSDTEASTVPVSDSRLNVQHNSESVNTATVTAISSNPAATITKKRSTNRGDAEAKLIGALTAHHKYADGSCLMQEPVGSNELARKAGVSPSTAFTFFQNNFESYTHYRRQCNDISKLNLALKMLNGDMTPRILNKAKPIEHAYQDDDRDDE